MKILKLNKISFATIRLPFFSLFVLCFLLFGSGRAAHIEKVLASNKNYLGEKNYKYFIGSLYNNIKVKSIHIMLPEVDSNHTSLSVIRQDSALKKDENYYPQMFLKGCKNIDSKAIRRINDNLSDFSLDDDESDEDQVFLREQF